MKTNTISGMMKVLLLMFILIGCTSLVQNSHAQSNTCTSGTLTLAQAKYAITQGGYGTGIVLGDRNSKGILEINPRTGNATVRNDTNCSLPISSVSYSINDPNDSDFQMQTWFGASSLTIVPPHSSVTLHVDLPPCNFQADFFYSDKYPRGTIDRFQKSENFLDAGYVVNRTANGGFSCPTTPPPEVPPEPPRRSRSNSFSISCPSIPNRVELGERVTRTVRISGGNSPYEIEWDGTDGLEGDDRTITKRYDRPGKKHATVTVTDQDNRARTDECNTIIVEEQRVYFVQQPVFTPPAFIPPAPPTEIYLSQIPYTGLEDYPLLELFLTAFVFWGIVLAGYMGYRKFTQLHKIS